MKSLFISLILISSLFLPQNIFAAVSPGVSLAVSRDRHFVYLTFSGLKTVSLVDYVLTYDSGTVQKGMQGGFRTKKYTSRSKRRQILGTCSSGTCVFQMSPKNFKLEITYTLRSGGVVTLNRTLQ
ncbi:hypothetical protein A2701_01770 [Candidatus Amesbacteria bacterium RIFCSPHIGHO2_01_FULL_47_34]|uniref:Cohesin domain-containing protein n=2 Tax=Candidatus Amesiibacteriota TaxID=1752730 RepID=A0A1F4ZQP7_9BACT|nr:MAG: hypothetical protein A2701_01770 [Candidatus Amesbacteria bacterium RIFCSPHIGHO2_01_FULL_47_34]OGD00495.1 MAG: hypothetical protein A2972_03300 [Candidatus Amesbacteria bacterium RIFCSPLOWO2_01_FULL_47_33]OGD08773.1 MAG: hypothetical protein A2395_02820 [Candidatus Amesbacteria bacterium RIFOXYB1_FULL_47_9]